MAKAKIGELENIQMLNKKYLLDEQVNKRIHERENKKLLEDLDNLSKLNEENLKQRVKENEANQSIVVKNNITSNEAKMNSLLQKYKKEEQNAKELLEEKNSISQRIAQIYEDIENQLIKEKDAKMELVDVKNAIHEYEKMIKEDQEVLFSLDSENDKLKAITEKLEIETKSINKNTEEIQQKIELNTILKDVDINELKILSQNNALVNSSINSLLSKWDTVQTKLQQIENNKDR